MTKTKRRRKGKRGRSIATTFRAIVLEGTGIIALILVVSFVRSGNATEGMTNEPSAISDLRDWVRNIRQSQPEAEATVTQTDFGQGFQVIGGSKPSTESSQQNFSGNDKWASQPYPVRTADFRSHDR